VCKRQRRPAGKKTLRRRAARGEKHLARRRQGGSSAGVYKTLVLSEQGGEASKKGRKRGRGGKRNHNRQNIQILPEGMKFLKVKRKGGGHPKQRIPRWV